MTLVVHTLQALDKALELFRAQRASVGFVPTMGALHEGHASLLKESAKENDCTVLSIFVNPTQFGPNEDFSKYPRTLDADTAIAEKNGVDIVFAPSSEEMYPPGFSTFIEPGDVARPLCGEFRPGHFRGVCTVVARLLGMVRPTRAYFGQKDIQQCLVLLRMVKDLALPVELKISPTVRESDGLAMSSRNRYLSQEDRKNAATIFQALKAAENKFLAGERNATALVNAAKKVLENWPEFRLQYLEARSYPDLQSAERLNERAVLAIAGLIGSTRLIDNFLLTAKN